MTKLNKTVNDNPVASNALLPCPFCGGAPYFTKSVSGNLMNHIGCADCGFDFKAQRTAYDLDAPMTRDIVAVWNRRAG